MRSTNLKFEPFESLNQTYPNSFDAVKHWVWSILGDGVVKPLVEVVVLVQGAVHELNKIPRVQEHPRTPQDRLVAAGDLVHPGTRREVAKGRQVGFR